MGARHFGARVARLEDPALLTGRGRFVDDIRLAGALDACFVRSPHADAAIRSIDASAARAMPGVHAVLTADDLPLRMANGQIPMLVPNPSIKTPRTQLALARREVCYVGQTIAVAIALPLGLATAHLERVVIAGALQHPDMRDADAQADEVGHQPEQPVDRGHLRHSL